MPRRIAAIAISCALLAATNPFAEAAPVAEKSSTFVEALSKCVGISRDWDRWKAQAASEGWQLGGSRKGAWGEFISLRKNEITLNGQHGPLDLGPGNFARCEVVAVFATEVQSTKALRSAEKSIEPIGRSPDVATVILPNGERVRFASARIGRDFITTAVLHKP